MESPMDLRENFSITAALETDIPVLLNMIRELAAFENLDAELQVTRESLRMALFGPRPAANAVVARSYGEAAGYAVYYRTFSTFVGRPGVFLDDVYVRPFYRKCGFGRALLERVARDGFDEKCGRFEWIALKWNENALQFYRNLGAEILEDWACVRMEGDSLQRLRKETS